jgi:hypothetical protein
MENTDWGKFNCGLSEHLSGETEENYKTFSQDSRWSNRDLNSVLPKYEFKVLTVGENSLGVE